MSDLDALVPQLQVLASLPRLKILHELDAPRALQSIRVQAVRGRSTTMSRQSVTHHLRALEEAGLVRRVAAAGGVAYVLRHDRLFALVDALRGLGRLRGVAAGTETLAGSLPAPVQGRSPAPSLRLVYGRDEGRVFEVPQAATIGRAEGCAVRLDYDPYVSARHATVRRVGDGLVLDDAGSRNGTWLNWQPVAPGASAPLRAGDVVTVGRSHLVVQG